MPRSNPTSHSEVVPADGGGQIEIGESFELPLTDVDPELELVVSAVLPYQHRRPSLGVSQTGTHVRGEEEVSDIDVELQIVNPIDLVEDRCQHLGAVTF